MNETDPKDIMLSRLARALADSTQLYIPDTHEIAKKNRTLVLHAISLLEPTTPQASAVLNYVLGWRARVKVF
jgi:hypothetical protein